MDKIEHINFLNYVTPCERKGIIEKINLMEIYKDFEKLKLLDDFLKNFIDDFEPYMNTWNISDLIKMLLRPSDKEIILTFQKLLGKDMYDLELILNKIILSDNIDKFKHIINKYSKTKLSDLVIPLDPITMITLSKDEFNIASLIVNLALRNHKIPYNKKNYIEFDKLEILTSLIAKENNYMETIIQIIKSTGIRSVREIESKVIIKTNTTIEMLNEIIGINNRKESIFGYGYMLVFFKLLLINSVYNNFKEILTMLYCCSMLSLLEMINTLKPELIDLDQKQLMKIIYYGRAKVFDFLFFNIPYKILDILKNSNPFDLSLFGDDLPSYIDDIDNGLYLNNDEREKRIVATTDIKHLKLIESIIQISLEKSYNHIIWTDEIKIQWMKLCQEYKQDTLTLYSLYFISEEDLLKLFNLKFDIKNKEDIDKHIKLFGKKITWSWIKNKADETILDLFF